MDYNSILNGTASHTEKNPEYNSKSKKNKEPKTIEVPSTKTDEDLSFYGAFNKNTEKGTMYYDLANDPHKYDREGIVLSKIDRPYLDKALADSQGVGTKLFNGLAQAAVSEILIGTVKSISDICDSIGQIIGLSDHDYTNPVSTFLEQKQEEFKQFAPVYTNPDAPDIMHGGLASAGWWASNMPSIASTLMLLIPSKLGVSALKGATKLTRLNHLARNTVRFASGMRKGMTASELTKFQRWANSRATIQAANAMIEHGASAALMRTIENYQEARQTFNQAYNTYSDYFNGMTPEQYQEFISGNENIQNLKDIDGNPLDINNRDSVAKAIASNAADTTFKLDYVNTVFDLFQLYALRNFGKLSKVSKKTSASIKKAQKESLANLNKTTEEIAESISKDSKWYQKLGDVGKNMFHNIGLTTAAEFSEGIEEAVNYIAQEEGIHYGNVLLGTEKANNFWDDRLARYLKAPELYDSAFWGVLGGVAFHYLGSAEQAIERKLEASKKRKEVGDVSEKLPWYDFGEDPEVARRITDITKRTTDYESYTNNVKSIKENNDLADAVKEEEIRKLTNEFVTDVSMRAARNGNLKLLKEFIADDNIRKHLVSTGVVSNEQEAIEHQRMLLDKVNKVDQLFDENMSRLEAITAALEANRGRKGVNTVTDLTQRIDTGNGRLPVFGAADVPVEYLMMIADRNTRADLNIVDYESKIAETRGTVDQELKVLRDANKLDPSIDYENTIRLGVYTHKLGLLHAELQKLKSGKNADTLSGQIAIDNVKNEIQTVEKLIASVYQGKNGNPKGELGIIANYLWSKTRAARFLHIPGDEFGKDDKVGITNNYKAKVSEDLDAWLVDTLGAEISYDYSSIVDITKLEDLEIPGIGSLKGRGFDSRAIAQEINLLDANNKRFFKLTGELDSGVDNVRDNPVLLDGLQSISALETLVASTKANKIVTARQTSTELAKIHNEMIEARGQAINTALNTISNLVEKYLKDEFDNTTPVEEDTDASDEEKDLNRQIQRNLRPLDYIDSLFANPTEAENALAEMSDTDKKLWQDAIKIINYTSTSNIALGRQIAEIIRRKYNERAQKTLFEKFVKAAEVSENDEKSSTTSEVSISEPQTAGSNKSKGNTAERNTIEFKHGIGNFIKEENGKLITRIQLDTNGKIVDFMVPVGAASVGDTVRTFDVELAQDENNPDIYTIQLAGNKPSTILISSEDLFRIDDLPIDGGVVRTNPVIQNVENGNPKIIGKGLVAKPERQYKDEEENPDDTPKEDNKNPPPAIPPVAGTVAGTVAGATETIDSINDEEKGKSTTHPSTGGGEQNSEQYSKVVVDSYEASEEVRKEFFDNLKGAKNEEEIDKILADSKAKADSIGATDTFKKTLEQSANMRKKIMALTKGKVPNVEINGKNISYAVILDNLYLETESNTNFYTGALQATDAFTESLKAALEGYAKLVNLNEINGKYYIVIQDFIKYCNRITGSDALGNILFSAVRDYLNTQGLTSFSFIDKSRINDAGYIKEINTNRQAKRNEDLASDDRVDIAKAINSQPDEKGRQKVINALNKLSAGDVITFETEEEITDGGFIKRRIAIKTNQKKKNSRVTIGYLPVPTPDGGGYTYSQQGWKVDVASVPGGDVSSSFMYAMINIIANSKVSGDAKTLRDLLYSIAFDSFSTDANKAKAARNRAINKAAALLKSDDVKLDKYFENNTGNDTDRVRYLATLLGYVRRNVYIDAETQDEIITDSVKHFFKKTLNSYNLANDLASRQSGNLVVSKMSKGRARFENKPGSEQHPKDGLTKEYLNNEDTCRIGIQTESQGFVDSKGERHPIVPHTGTSLVALKNDNEWVYVRTWAQGLNGKDATPFVKGVKKAIKQEISRLLLNNKNISGYQDLFNFFYNLLGTNRKNNALMSGADFVYLKNDKGFRVKLGSEYITFFSEILPGRIPQVSDAKGKYHNIRNKNGELTKYINDFVDKLLDNVKFNFAYDHLCSSEVNTGLLRKNSKGEIEIKIGDSTWKFNSYRDYVLNSGMTKLSISKKVTKVGRTTKESNFYDLSDETPESLNQRAHQYLRVTTVSDSNVNKSDEEEEAPKRVSEEQFTDVKGEVDEILNRDTQDGENDGYEIVKTVLPEVSDRLNIVEYNGEIISLFPDKIQLDTTMKEVAAYDNKTGTTRISSLLYNYLLSTKPGEVKAGVKLLVHERLHNILKRPENKEKLKKIQTIYDAFRKYCENNEVADSVKLFLFDKTFKDKLEKAGIDTTNKGYLNADGTLTEQGLEEFLVYSLTDSKLANALNSIPIENEEIKDKPKSLLQAIMDIVSDIFGWGIKANSLYAKEFNILSDMINTDVEISNDTEKQTEESEITNTTPVEEEVIEEPVTAESKKSSAKYNPEDDMDIDEDNDDDEYYSVVIDDNELSGSNVPNIAFERANMSADTREKFDALVDKGVIYQVCN